MTETDKDEVFHLKLTGKGLTIDKQVDAGLAAAIAQMTFGGPSPRGTPLGPTAALRPNLVAASGQRLSLREYLQAVGAGRGIHIKILAVGRHMRDFEKQEDFSREEVRSRFRSAGEPQPANFARDFQKAVREGWIAEDPKNIGRFYVTRTGDDEIDARLARGSTSEAPPRRRRRSRQTRGEGAEQ